MKQETLQLTGGGTNRRALDYYPTPKNVTVALMDFLKLPKCVIWEPACGTGEMARVLESYGHEVLSSDIQTGDDYLKTFKTADAIITNPPFNQSNLFIEKSLNEANIVAFLLKSQYWHAKNKYDLFYKSKPSWILPLTWRPDFLEHERVPGEKKGSPTMEVLWTVWIKGDNNTKYELLKKPII